MTAGSEEVAEAQVVWTSASSARVRVEPGEGRADARERSIEFRPSDAPDDRFRALGLVIASLASSDETHASPEAPEAPEHARAWLEGGAELGRGLDPGPLRRGGFLSGGYHPSGVPLFFAAGADFAGSSPTPDGVTPVWTTFTLGAGFPATFPSLDLSLRLRLDLAFQRVVAEADERPDRADSGSRWLAGAGASMELVWPAASRFGFVLGAAGHFASGGTGVRVHGTKVASFPAIGYDARLGIQVGLFP